jgi:hypothetical protein
LLFFDIKPVIYLLRVFIGVFIKLLKLSQALLDELAVNALVPIFLAFREQYYT